MPFSRRLRADYNDWWGDKVEVVIGIQTVVLGFVALLVVLQGRYLARILEQIVAGDRAIYIQGHRIEETVKDTNQLLKARA